MAYKFLDSTGTNYLWEKMKSWVAAQGYKTTDNNTWRPVVNNLTSTATDSSLSAAQGKALNDKIAAIIDGSQYVQNAIDADSALYASEAGSVAWANVTGKTNATTSTAGLMSATDKTNLDTIVNSFNSDDADTTIETIKEVLKVFESYPAGTSLANALAGKLDKSGGSLNNSATLKFTMYGTRTVTISGNSIDADMSADTGTWAGNFATVKHSKGTTTMLGWYGSKTDGLYSIFMGGSYSDPAMKMDASGNFTFKNTITGTITNATQLGGIAASSYATTSALSNYMPLSGGTFTGVIKTIENAMGLKLRTHASYETGWVYGTSGNEAITLAMQNPVTAFQIVYGTKPSEFSSATWQSVTPLFQTKDGKVIINRKITATSETTNLKLFDVNGDANATTLYENGTALSDKYQAKGTYITPTTGSEYYPKYIQTRLENKTGWYGTQYPIYAWWETGSICKWVVDNYETKVDRAIKDANGNNIASTYLSKSGGTITGVLNFQEDGAFFPHITHTDVDGETYTLYIPATNSTLATESFVTGALANYLPKTTYEYNKEIAFGSTGKLYIGAFPMYDSNITVEISATTSTTYNATLVIATQNINTTGGGSLTATVYGDATNTIAPNIYIGYASGSNQIHVYFSPQAWSKNLIHIQAVALAGAPSNVCTSVDSVPSTANRQPTNALTANFQAKGNYLTSHLYRPITVNGTQALVNTSSQTLDLAAGTNISLSYSGGTVTINSTATGSGDSSLIWSGGSTVSSVKSTIHSTAGTYAVIFLEVEVDMDPDGDGDIYYGTLIGTKPYSTSTYTYLTGIVYQSSTASRMQVYGEINASTWYLEADGSEIPYAWVSSISAVGHGG